MKAFMLLLFCALAISLPAVAETSPQEFLAAILQHDFDGDGGFRIDKALFTTGLCSKLPAGRMMGRDPACPEAREYFKAEANLIELVAKWEFAGAGSVTRDKAMLPVRFAAIAETMRNTKEQGGNRLLKPLATSREVLVTYRLTRRGKEWALDDPPLPRVGLSALNRILREEVQRLDEVIKDEITQPRPRGTDPLVVKSLTEYRDMETTELAELDALARRMNLPLDAETGEGR
jgi:hypothetical protein